MTSASPRTAPPHADVVIVGAGPVGMTCALLLAKRNHTVVVLERWPTPYARPRAVHFDDEVARLFANAGIGSEIAALTEPADTYEWQNARGETLLSFDWGGPGPSGWPTASMMYQPELERTLAAAAATSAHITLLRGHEAVDLAEHPGHVEVTSRAQDGTRHTVRGAYVVGCDGANSFVRGHLPHGETDLGFFHDWLIVDVRPHDHRAWNPVNLQICDPRRPTTVVSGGPGRRRWEFMRMPGETVDELNTEETAWRLLAAWDLDPGNCDLERHAVYTFQARWAHTWRAGRLLLAGDAAHLMPPFAGQGMCSGIRDAANLSWKVSLVLDGRADTALLDTYGTERAAHVQRAIDMSVALGKVICVTDPEEAARRDSHMISQGADPARILPPRYHPPHSPAASSAAPERAGSPYRHASVRQRPLGCWTTSWAAGS
ncbi:bifunctional 3-(3-hydroxy-phenyl)propionate/3-hydroxycinnamic acid hydroxylase MhpA [Streptomyces tendae]|uniref:bifunctional 3-(3-hydroxy-phenyl)propionate/3-hydroxycinnamic acid hydroxylase MhpA n=1 Tax=Streptomyces tendae TaxID=1932 RepID=UPI00368B2DF2